jgi:PAS domain S-box-containing protein
VTQARIMIVEDESIVALDVRHRLERLGYAVPAIASSGEEAIAKATETRPDLVLMDIRLRGDMDGVEAAAQIRARFEIPIVYLTAFADEETLRRAKVTEPYGYVLKPFEERELHAIIEMALHKHEMARKLRESEQWLATTLKSIGDAVIATDARGCIKFMNSVAEALTGWKREEALGQNAAQVFHIINEETQHPAESPVTRALEENRIVSLENHTLLVSKDCMTTPIDDSAAPIRDERGNVIGVVLVFRDITERKQAEETVRRYTAELEARNEELDAFAHTVAHDLKGPLAHMVGFAQVLEQDYAEMPDEEQHRCLHTIAQSGRKMGSIIDELLLLSSVRQVLDIEMQSLDMADIVSEAMQRLAATIEEHQAEIILPDIWPVTLGYAPWVEEVWVNYLSNAIKYGGQPPCVELGATVESDGMVHAWVRDNGPGIPPHDQARLFTPFTRLDQARADGYGLGLSIVRRIVERLGGRVAVESDMGQGSVFSFTLPADGTNREADE